MCFYFFVFGSICHTSFAEPTRGFILGIKIGTHPIYTYFKSYSFGGEAGYQLTDHLSIIGDFAYGTVTNWEPGPLGAPEMPYYGATYSCMPIRASLLKSLIKAKTFSIYLGGGLGYYLITVKKRWNETIKIKGFAPHVNIGMELRILKRGAIFVELKKVFGPKWLKEIDEYDSPWDNDVHFRRPELIIGIRFYFKD
jgi:hypothetical protein